MGDNSERRTLQYAVRMQQLIRKGFTAEEAADYLGLAHLAGRVNTYMLEDEQIRYQAYKAREKAIDAQSQS